MLTAGSISYTYDGNGNQLSAGTRTFTYDLANRLIATTQGSTTTSYAYDGEGNRLQASTGAAASEQTNYRWDVNGGLPQLVTETDGNDTLRRRYVHGYRPIFMSTGSDAFYYHYDPLGSVRDLTSDTGATQLTYDYEPYGTTRAQTGTSPSNLLKFTSQYEDPTDYYYLRARQYDPVSGRFHREDPVVPSRSRPYVASYVYTANRPTLLNDPSGETMRPSDGSLVSVLSAASPSDVSGTTRIDSEADRMLAANSPLAPCQGDYVARNSKGFALGLASLQTNPANRGVLWGFRLAKKVQVRFMPTVTAYVKYFVNGREVAVPTYYKTSVPPSYLFHANVGSSSTFALRGDSGAPRRRLAAGDRLILSMGFVGTVPINGGVTLGIGAVKCQVRG